MTPINQWLAATRQTFTEAGIETARLDSLILLEDATGRDRAWLLAHDDEQFPDSPELAEAVRRRATHEPLAYIRGHAEFYGRDFKVGPEVLVPRPESEAIIDMSTSLARRTRLGRIADIGTGSGCLGITLSLELPEAETWLTDVYTNVYTFVEHNAREMGASIRWAEGDLMDPLPPEPFDIVVANLPYVPDKYPINAAAAHEPEQALFSGPDGLDHYRRFWVQAAVRQPRYVILEALPDQHHNLALLARQAGYVKQQTDGFAVLFSL